MILAPNLANLLDAQHSHELSASAAYTHLANEMHVRGFVGCSAYFDRAAVEEQTHAATVRAYRRDRAVEPIPFVPIDTPAGVAATPFAAFRTALALEEANTAQWQAIADAAVDARDWTTLAFAQPFLDEQRRTESELGVILQKLTLAGTDPAALLAFDHEAGEGEL